MLVEEFFGSDLSTEEYDTLAAIAIDDRLFKVETELMDLKWFEYRHLHPTQATYLYAHHYTLEYRKIFQKIVDQSLGAFVTGSKGKDAMKKTETVGFWKGRQQADRLGMPYDYYIGSAMRFLIEGKIWKRVPRPVHLYSKPVIEHVSNYWVETLLVGTIEPSTAHLSHDNDFTMQCKSDIARWLCEALKTRKNPHFGLSHYMFEKMLIPENIALQYFDADVISQAKRLSID